MEHPMSRGNLELRIRCCLVLVLLALAGCGSGTGAVTGRVTFRGKPVVSGSVVMVGVGNKLVSGPLDAEGRYALNGVPLGTVQVAVVSPNPNPRRRVPRRLLEHREKKMKLLEEKKDVQDSPPPVAPKVDRSKWFPLPKQYELADTSGTTTTIHCGDNTFDIELK
jgi:hypothetical protein